MINKTEVKERLFILAQDLLAGVIILCLIGMGFGAFLAISERTRHLLTLLLT